ncbi:MAG: hypothetical protein RLY27_2335 [Pseudomonadota bacterium]|jgi:hypothetical protein
MAQDNTSEVSDNISAALNVNGYDAPFGYNDDIFLHDTWEKSNALNYLVGIEWHSFDERENLILKTLAHKQYSSETQPEIVDAFFSELQRLHDLWHTGVYVIRNKPEFYIQWAKSKRIDIPWLKYAEENELFVSTITAASVSQQSLHPRVENNYLRLIHSLCLEIPGFDINSRKHTIARLIIDQTGVKLCEETLAGIIEKVKEINHQERD